MGDYINANAIADLNVTLKRIAGSLELLVEDKQILKEVKDKENKDLSDRLNYYENKINKIR